MMISSLLVGGVSKDVSVITNLAKIPFPGRYQNQRFVDSEFVMLTMIIYDVNHSRCGWYKVAT